MSLNTNLSKLQGLIKKFHANIFNLRDYTDIIELLKSVSLQADLLEQARARTVLVDRLLIAIQQMTDYAEKHPMPPDTDYGEECRLFRLSILMLDERKGYGDNVFLISESTFFNKPIKAGVYHWECPSVYGWDAPDIIRELTPEYLDKLNLSNEKISKIIEAADTIVQDGILTSVSEEDKNEKYKERWPNAEAFSCWESKVESPDALDQLKTDQLSVDFDVELIVDFESCRMKIFGPEDNVQRLYEYLRQLEPYVVSFYSHSGGKDINWVKGL